ncbi:MAG: ABC transporter ATP-binding protein [Pseudomonadota bacterium]
MSPLVVDRLSVEALGAGRARARLLRAVSMEVRPGSVHGLVGESGAGKSTLAKAVLGILPPGLSVTGGSIRVAGRDHLTARAPGDVSFIPQDPLSALNPSRRIRDQLADALRRSGASRGAADEEMRRLLTAVRIDETERVLKSYPHQLSGGMRQRVLIASAFSTAPKLILADEPTTALDVTVQRRILKLIRAMQRDAGAAMIFVTHDLGVVAQICDEVTVLYAGKVVEQGPVAQIFHAPRHPYTRALLAASPRPDGDQGLTPVDPAVFTTLAAEIADFDAAEATP